MERQRDGWTGDNCDADDDMQHGPVGDEDGDGAARGRGRQRRGGAADDNETRCCSA
jgi:hypothetical protein